MCVISPMCRCFSWGPKLSDGLTDAVDSSDRFERVRDRHAHRRHAFESRSWDQEDVLHR